MANAPLNPTLWALGPLSRVSATGSVKQSQISGMNHRESSHAGCGTCGGGRGDYTTVSRGGCGGKTCGRYFAVNNVFFTCSNIPFAAPASCIVLVLRMCFHDVASFISFHLALLITHVKGARFKFREANRQLHRSTQLYRVFLLLTCERSALTTTQKWQSVLSPSVELDCFASC